MRVRRAVAGDSAAAAAVVRAVYEEFGFTWDEAGYHADLRDVEESYAAFFVAENDGRVVGTAGLTSHGSLERLYVLAEARGSGAGSALLAAVVAEARRQRPRPARDLVGQAVHRRAPAVRAPRRPCRRRACARRPGREPRVGPRTRPHRLPLRTRRDRSAPVRGLSPDGSRRDMSGRQSSVPICPQGRSCGASGSSVGCDGPSAPLDVSRLRRLARDDARGRTASGLPRPRRRPSLPRPALAGGRAARAACPRSLPDAEPLPPRRPVPARPPLASAAPRQRRLRRGLQREVHPQRPPLGRPLRALAGARRRASPRDL